MFCYTFSVGTLYIEIFFYGHCHLLIKKLTEQSKHSLKQKVNKAKLALFTQCKENLIAILLVFTTLIGLILMMSAIDARENRIPFAVTLLSINYLLLFLLIIATNPFNKWLLDLNLVKKDNKAKKPAIFFLHWLYNHNIAFSFIMVFSTILIFEEVHRINIIYNFTITFSFALILYRIVLFIKEKSQHQPQSLDLKTQKIYMIYASFIALSFIFSTTVDKSDYGTQFQLTILSWVMLFHLLSHWMTGQWKLVKQLKNERTNAELMHLKSQVNPHFLFNTLNNLYGLALEKSDQTPGLILKLSDMLRYTIYQGKKDQVLLKDEVNYLNDFIQLQQIRYHKPVNITFNNEIAESGLVISPLLLLILVENAYKHGVEKLTDEAFILIKLEAEEQSMVFEIENNFDESEQSSNTGIGLQNLKQRLKLIYPDLHRLEIASENGVYSVRLEIQLKS
jgi:two-component system sensor histidine kinase AlgZ